MCTRSGGCSTCRISNRIASPVYYNLVSDTTRLCTTSFECLCRRTYGGSCLMKRTYGGSCLMKRTYGGSCLRKRAYSSSCLGGRTYRWPRGSEFRSDAARPRPGASARSSHFCHPDLQLSLLQRGDFRVFHMTDTLLAVFKTETSDVPAVAHPLF